MDGLLVVRKEKGFTSFDVVAVLRGILHQKKIGHAGTLDPDAEGVLVCLLGNATKLVETLSASGKEYEAVLRLGMTTDTQDGSGTVLTTREVKCTEEEVLAVLPRFEGEIEQIPPMYSAVKVNGKRLYDLARKGKIVERSARKAVIHSITPLVIALPDVQLRIACGKGTYIRTLCNDIGEALGCGGTMLQLLRTRSGMFTLADACTLGEIRAIAEEEGEEGLKKIILPVEACFSDAIPCQCDLENDRLLRNGNAIRMEDGLDGALYRMHLSDGRFAAIYRYEEMKHLLVPDKMFLPEGESR